MSGTKTRVLITGGSGFIGTRLISDLLVRDMDILNIDLAAPKIEAHRPFWRKACIECQAAVDEHMAAFKPQAVVHLAAKADFDPQPEAFHRPNIEGARHVVEAALAHQVGRLILASTQYVNGPGTPFDDDVVCHPVNAYGASKAEMERLVRSSCYDALDWTIIRPTNVWGPFHPRFPSEMWRYLRLGLYLHPGGPAVVRAYGYVGNVSRQIIALLQAPADRTRHRVFYVGDPPIDSGAFLDAISRALRGKPVRRVPRGVLRLAGQIGDGLRWFGVKAPLFTDRVVRITSDHLARDEEIWRTVSYHEISLEAAIQETVDWLRQTYPDQYGRQPNRD